MSFPVSFCFYLQTLPKQSVGSVWIQQKNLTFHNDVSLWAAAKVWPDVTQVFTEASADDVTASDKNIPPEAKNGTGSAAQASGPGFSAQNTTQEKEEFGQRSNYGRPRNTNEGLFRVDMFVRERHPHVIK